VLCFCGGVGIKKMREIKNSARPGFAAVRGAEFPGVFANIDLMRHKFHGLCKLFPVSGCNCLHTG
jgi:hypothetical protein